MKRALFVTVAAHEVYMPVAAWRNHMGPCAHIMFQANGSPNDDGILACARGYKPDVIFYIGAHGGSGLPSFETLKALRRFAPTILYQSDVEDEAWWEPLRAYRKAGCFDLIVGQTGVETDLIDMATLIAVDVKAFDGAKAKNIYCGFSGSARDITDYRPGFSAPDGRADILHGLANRLAYRPREPIGEYRSYVEFLKRCMIVLNISLTGSGRRHHVKWRVLEAAFADCALLEMAAAPTARWFPADTYLRYETAGEAKRVLQNLRLPDIGRIARRFAAYARTHYMPWQIYGGILEALP